MKKHRRFIRILLNRVKKKKVKIVFNVNKKMNANIYVYSMTGRLVDTFAVKIGETPNDKLYKINIDVLKYFPGIYFYKIQGTASDGSQIDYKSKKFMIRK